MRDDLGFAGVLGWPLGHTLSPAIHNAAFRELALDWVYLAFPVPPAALGAAVGGLRALGCMGANVTMPHKETVMEHLDEVSGDAGAVEAVNTIERVGDELVGRNTDVDGFEQFLLTEVGYSMEGREALVLGAGGAARAVVRALDDLGAGLIVVAARRDEEAARAARVASLRPATTVGFERAGQAAGSADVVVNATPLGMDGRSDPVPGAAFRRGQVVVDLIYEPPSTPLIERARAAGADAWGGLGMLVRQAAGSFRIWTGRDAPIEIMSAAAVRAIGRRGHVDRSPGAPE